MINGFILFLFLSFLLAGCHTPMPRNQYCTQYIYSPNGAYAEVEAAAQMNRSVVSTINFAKGRQVLTAQAAQEIQSAIAEARKMGEIKSIDVAVWSDQEYPKHGAELPRREVSLADERAENIEKLIDSASPEASVKTYNMAKEPNAFQKWVETRDAYLKTKLVETGVITSNGEAVPETKRASSALLFIEVKQ